MEPRHETEVGRLQALHPPPHPRPAEQDQAGPAGRPRPRHLQPAPAGGRHGAESAVQGVARQMRAADWLLRAARGHVRETPGEHEPRAGNCFC